MGKKVIKKIILLVVILNLLISSYAYGFSPNKYTQAGFFGQCTYWAYEKWPQITQKPPSTGNAYEWIIEARKKNYDTGTTPTVGAIAVWDKKTGGAGSVGHVAYVEKVNSSTSFGVSEYNWPVGAGKRTRTVTLVPGINFIYPEGTAPAGNAKVSSLTISKSPVIVGQDFDIKFKIQEVKGADIKFDKLAVVILDSSDNKVFTAKTFTSKIAVSANESWSKTVSTKLGSNLAPGKYKVLIRGMLDGKWTDLGDKGSAENPRKFTAVSQQVANIPGDLNKDGKVDLYDYNILRANFGKTDCGNLADINGDCIVNLFDYGILHTNYGKGN